MRQSGRPDSLFSSAYDLLKLNGFAFLFSQKHMIALNLIAYYSFLYVNIGRQLFNGVAHLVAG